MSPQAHERRARRAGTANRRHFGFSSMANLPSNSPAPRARHTRTINHCERHKPLRLTETLFTTKTTFMSTPLMKRRARRAGTAKTATWFPTHNHLPSNSSPRRTRSACQFTSSRCLGKLAERIKSVTESTRDSSPRVSKGVLLTTNRVAVLDSSRG